MLIVTNLATYIILYIFIYTLYTILFRVHTLHMSILSLYYTAPGDYTATSRNVTFEPRVLVQIISVRTERNTKVHGSKIFRASLSNPSAGLSIVEQNVSEVTMLDRE